MKKKPISILFSAVVYLSSAMISFFTDNEYLRNIVIGGSLLLTILLIIVAIPYLINSLKDNYIYDNIVSLKRCGIKGIYMKERASDRIEKKISEIKKLKIIAVSGTNMLKALEHNFVKLLTENHAEIQIIVGCPYSDFIKDIESCEYYQQTPNADSEINSDPALNFRANMISQEIEHAIKNLNICITNAIKIQKTAEECIIGNLELKHFNTEMRSSIVIINDEWAWLTLNLPPAKALYSLSIEFYKKDKDSYINEIITHFNTVYALSKECTELKKCEIERK